MDLGVIPLPPFTDKIRKVVFDGLKAYMEIYLCKECGKYFSANKVLKSHMTTHNSEKKLFVNSQKLINSALSKAFVGSTKVDVEQC